MISGKETVVRIVKGSTDTAPTKLHKKAPVIMELPEEAKGSLHQHLMKSALIGFAIGCAFFFVGRIIGLFAPSAEASLMMGAPALLGAVAGYIIY